MIIPLIMPGFFTLLPQVDVIAPDAVSLKKWDGYVRSRLRMMVKNMEDSVNARPLPKDMHRPQGEGAAPCIKSYFLCVTKRAAQVGVKRATMPCDIQNGWQDLWKANCHHMICAPTRPTFRSTPCPLASAGIRR